MELVEEMEEVLSARAKGATGGGLAEWAGGLNGRFWKERKRKVRHNGERSKKFKYERIPPHLFNCPSKASKMTHSVSYTVWSF